MVFCHHTGTGVAVFGCILRVFLSPYKHWSGGIWMHGDERHIAAVWEQLQHCLHIAVVAFGHQQLVSVECLAAFRLPPHPFCPDQCSCCSSHNRAHCGECHPTEYRLCWGLAVALGFHLLIARLQKQSVSSLQQAVQLMLV